MPRQSSRLPAKRGGRTPYAELNVLNPGKGLNNLISDNLIDDKESSSLENIMFVESGAPAKRTALRVSVLVLRIIPVVWASLMTPSPVTGTY
jgi:hypothetical protein